MTTSTPTLSDWLLAQIAADEEVARAAQNEGTYPYYGATAAAETLEMAYRDAPGFDDAWLAS